ncbi:hypothetical protein J2T41_000864 [Pseudomonas citronellolis]|uniref:co-regulatory protein PtrA N-terminal domain-containing protein n=1 Tax=Pseudomonas citronellolis TaxID=53408 RepID=UPI0020A12A5F|nr:co-regulatory protein PtrA N-terminal domain-containing protein [Pseudomonas citronellolis]MCP1641268.1 hypothetical protein [Pseudomonas citronellolis]MCP1664186.1 hypothetical protein [Pseudomonas citronellolis]MCP1695160.1 hypothetical protein [Pseudomonas citronellolis]MCP1702021.1 hypothetical protein [Pseudomonas citronellolis]MCP1795907.1 hypothetical protein [Pseudomonas citronellolis]
MNLFRPLLLAGLLGVSSLALAESGGDRTFARMEQNRLAAMAVANPTAQADDFRRYEYGMRLDIAQVLEVTPARGCGVVPVRMRYLDSDGAEQRLEYRAERVSCNRGK